MSILKRLSSSLIVLRPSANNTYEILLIQRSRKMKFAGQNWVFPGGVYDVSDGNGETDGFQFSNNFDVIRDIALRECFEETGIVPIKNNAAPSSSNMTASTWQEWRERIHNDASLWKTFVSEQLNADSIHKCPSLCCFLTPKFEAERSKRQYLTHFLITSIPSQKETTSQHEAHWYQDNIDNSENVRSVWMTPQEALKQYNKGDMPMFPPQFYILQRLCAFKSVKEAIDSAQWFSRDASNIDSSLAIVMQPETNSNVAESLVLPYDEYHQTYPGTKGAIHRMDVFTKNKMQVHMNAIAAEKVVGKKNDAWRWNKTSSKL